MNKSQHTPTLAMIEIPGGTQYHSPPDRIHGTVFVAGTDKVFARCPESEVARQIVRAVNSHAALIEALETFERCAYAVDTRINPRGHDWMPQKALDYALKLARKVLEQAKCS